MLLVPGSSQDKCALICGSCMLLHALRLLTPGQGAQPGNEPAPSSHQSLLPSFGVCCDHDFSRVARGRRHDQQGGHLLQYAHAQGTACCAWHSASLHLRGRFLEPILPVCAALWGDAEGLPAGPTGAAGAMPGGGLWPVQRARLAAASCPRRLSASSELLASSAFSCPAASSRAYSIIPPA